MKKAILLGLIVLSLAAPAQTTTVLTFDDAVRLATQHNADLHRARAAVAAADFQRRAAGSGFLPQLSASVGRSDDSGDTVTGDGSTYTASLTATQNVFAGFADQSRLRRSEWQLRSAEAALANRKSQLSRDLKVAYATLLYAQKSVELSDSILQRLEENVRLVELRFEGGRENRGSLLFTRASVTQARADQLQALQNFVSAQAELGRVVGDVHVAWRAIDSVPVTAPATAPEFAGLLDDTPRVQQAIAEQEEAEAAIQLARAGFYPSVDLRGSVSRSGDDWFPREDRASVTATISIPLYAGGRNFYGLREALANADGAKSQRQAVAQEVMVDLKRSYAAYREAVERLNVAEQFLQAAQTRAQIARARYQNGLISFEDWDRIESDLIQRQKNALSAQRERVVSEAAWEFAQGKGIIP
jgi:outer membrane protein